MNQICRPLRNCALGEAQGHHQTGRIGAAWPPVGLPVPVVPSHDGLSLVQGRHGSSPVAPTAFPFRNRFSPTHAGPSGPNGGADCGWLGIYDPGRSAQRNTHLNGTGLHAPAQERASSCH